MQKDFNDLLSAFNAHSVRYLIVGGYAYARYTEPRATKDLDILVDPDPQNASAVYQALLAFGAYLADVTAGDFANRGTVFQIGVAPFRIDVLNDIDGLSFQEAWETSEAAFVDDTIPVRYISRQGLISNKLAARRPQDLLDVDNLRKSSRSKSEEH